MAMNSTENISDRNIDVAHLSRLSRREQEEALSTAEQFLDRITHLVDTAYLHLDVDTFKEQHQNTPAYRWRALLMTNRGRYHADGWSYGAVESVKVVLDKLHEQLTSRIERLNEQLLHA